MKEVHEEALFPFKNDGSGMRTGFGGCMQETLSNFYKKTSKYLTSCRNFIYS